MAKLILVRGLPGSGKSTYAQGCGTVHLEADMFFMRDGSYNFDPNTISNAHSWCLSTAKKCMDAGMDVVVSNTFTQLWEMQKYIDYAEEVGHTLHVISCMGEYGNVHSVPAETLKKMKDRWELYEGEEVIW
jgi:predicted kinase